MKAMLKRVARRGLDIITGKDVEPALVMGAPSAQNALDVFKGEWLSGGPPSLPLHTGGRLPLFEDERLTWAIDALGGVRDRSVLELGPLEAGHSYTLQARGARSVLAIEGNQRCYLKCLVMKEVTGLHAVRFELGNFVEYLRAANERFDVCVAAGVLYHMAQPVELLHLIARATDRVYLWTHYYDAAKVKAALSAGNFSGVHDVSYGTFTCTAQRHEYFATNRRTRFAGGLQPYSHWLTREDLLRCLSHLGFTRVEIAFEEPDHVHGPCLALVADRG